MRISVNLNNTATNGLEYKYQGYVQLWIVKYGTVSSLAAPGEYTFKKLVGDLPVSTVLGLGNAVIDISDTFLETNTHLAKEYLYLEARYYLRNEKIGYTSGDAGYIGSDLFYVAIASPVQPSIALNVTFADEVQVLVLDLYSHAIKFESGTDGPPISNILVNVKIYDNTAGAPVLLLDLGDAETDSLGVVVYEWVAIPNQYQIKVTTISFNSTSSFIVIREREQQTTIAIDQSLVNSFVENIIPDVEKSVLLTELAITPSPALTAFLDDPAHPLTSLRKIRKWGYLPDLSGYSTLGATDISNLNRINAQSRLNLIYFAESLQSSSSKYIKFNDLLYTNAKSVSSAFDIVNKFAAGEFVTHGRTLRATMPALDQPSDFSLAGIYTLAQRQMQMGANLMSAAAADLRYKSGTNAGKKVFVAPDGHSKDCECEECMTAVSPLSYLSALISYSGQNVKIKATGAQVTVEGLSTFFKQPLNDLKIDCEEVSKKLCNFRVQVEILYKYSLSLLPAPSDCSKRVFNIMKAEFVQSAYNFFLNYIGTDYNTLKAAQNDIDAKKALAEKLGIPYEYGVGVFPVQALYFNIKPFKTFLNNPLSTGFTGAITSLQLLMEDVFGFRKDSTDPLIDLGDCDYLLWRREFTRVSWVNIDDPAGEFLTVKNYYIDPDLVNMDDIRYNILDTTYPVLYDATLPPAGNVLVNRKKWSETTRQFLTNDNLKSTAGFVVGSDEVKLAVAFDPDAEVVSGTPVIITQTDNNAGTYLASKIQAFTVGGGQFGLVLKTPLKDNTIDETAKIRFQIGYKIDSYDTVTDRATIVQPMVQYLSAPFIRFYNPTTKKFKVIDATKSGAGNAIFQLPPGTAAAIQGDFPAVNPLPSPPLPSKIYFEVEIPVFVGAAPYNMAGSLELGVSKIAVFGNIASEFAAEREVTISSSLENDGTYVIPAGNASLNTYPQGSFMDINCDVTLLTIKRTGTISQDIKKYLTGGAGEGKLSYEIKGGNVSYYSNGYSLNVNAYNQPLAVGNNRILAGDFVLFNELTSFAKLTIASLSDIPSTTNSEIKLRESLPQNFFQQMQLGTGQVKILVKAVYVNGTDLFINGRSLALTAFAGNVVVYENGNYESSTAVTLTASGADTKITKTIAGPAWNAASSFELGITGVAVPGADKTSPYFVLTTPQTGLPNKVTLGSKIEIYDSKTPVPVLKSTFTAQEATNTTTIYVNETISLSTDFLPYTLSYFPEYPVVCQFTRYSLQSAAASPDSLFQKLNLASNADFQYTPVYTATPPAVPVAPTVWSFGSPPANFYVLLQVEANNLKNGLSSTYPATMKLSNDAFIRFVELYLIFYRYIKTPALFEPLTEEEDRELHAIIRLSIKNAIIATLVWKNEEAALLSNLNTTYPAMKRLQDPRLFQVCKYSPQISDFKEKLYYNTSVPYIDGQFPLLAKIPSSWAGREGRTLLSYRETEFSGTNSVLTSYFDVNGVNDFLKAVWGGLIKSNVSVFIETIFKDMNSNDASMVKKAEALLEFMQLTTAEFERLRRLRKEWLLKKLLPEAQGIRDEIVGIIGLGFKQASTYAYWKKSEQEKYTVSSLLEYWLIKQEKLVPWLSTAVLRGDWKKAMEVRQAYVAVDPDLIDIKYLENITDNSLGSYRAFDLMNERINSMVSWITLTTATPPGTLPVPPAGAASEQQKAKFYVEYFLRISENELVGIFDALDLGEDISGRLKELNCTPAMFYRIKDLVEAVTGTVLLADVQDELFNILVAVRKWRTYCEWRDKEVKAVAPAVSVVISPEFFKDPVLPYGSAQNANAGVRWRFSGEQLQVWKRLFRARKLIWNSLAKNVAEMNKEADDATMMILRNAYIELVAPEDDGLGNKYSFEEKTQILSDRFLQDFAVQCCSITSRVATAIATMQRLFYILNTETDGVKYPVLNQYVLNAPYFDKEWKWLGGYGSFRSAMFVYLYPENLLHPALRKKRTPKFAEITAQLNEGGVFTPGSACKLANDYLDYMVDVTGLTSQAGANVLLLDKKGPCDDKKELGYKKTFFGFAKALQSKKIYYTQQEIDSTETPCLNWMELKQFGTDAVKVIGTAAAKKSSGKRYLYLFVLVLKLGKYSVVYLKYDLDELFWEEEYMEMEFPEKTNWNSIIVLQRHGERNPVLFFTKTVSGITSLWMNMIQSQKDEWQWSTPLAMASSKWFNTITPIAAQEIGNTDWLNYDIAKLVIVYEKDGIGNKNLILQPFSVANPNSQFGGIPHKLRPGKFYGIRQDLNLFTVNNGEVSNKIDGTLFGAMSFQGIYSYSSVSDGEFGILVKRGNENTKLVKMQLSQVLSTGPHFNDITSAALFNKYVYQYFNVDLKEVKIKFKVGSSDMEKSFLEILLFAAAASNSTVLNLQATISQIMANPFYNNGISGVILQAQVALLQNQVNQIVANQNAAFMAEKLAGYYAILDFVKDESAIREDDPTWNFIYNYIVCCCDFGTSTTSSSIPLPGNQSLSGRPRYYDIVGGIMQFPSYSKKVFGLAGEFEIKKLDVNSSSVLKMLPGCFLNTNRNFALGYNMAGKNTMFKFTNSNFISLSLSNPVNLTPAYSYSGRITANHNSSDFQKRRVNLKKVFTRNMNQCTFMRVYAEAYFFLPLTIAMKLHECGYFEESLAWFRAVYDYNWKNLSERKIWYGLVVEEAINNNYTQSANWLIDPLNPHQIALTRSGAYTAFTVQSLVKCLLDYADQQFTNDTVESIPLATHLYEEVQLLMNLEQFKPNSESCGCGDDTLSELWEQLRCLSNIGFLLLHSQAIEELAYLIDQVESCADKDALIAAAASYFTGKR